MKEFEIYFRDLKPEVQKKLLEEVGVGTPEEMNWDVFPITTVVIGYEALEEEI